MKFSLRNYLPVLLLFGMVSCQLKAKEEAEAEELEADGMEAAMRQQFQMTRDPMLNIVPRERLEIAKQQATAISNANFRMSALSWQERGPNNVGGRTRAILVDSRDATGNTVWAGSVSGGLFKTSNFTAATPSWTPVNDQMLNLAITCLVQDRTTPTIMYAGTGEGWFNIDAVQGAGIFKSTDGGLTWNRLPSTAQFEYVQDVVIDNNGYVYAALRNASTAFRGVNRSTDGGTTWTQVLGIGATGSPHTFTTGRAADLEVAPNGDVYATLGIFTRTQLFKSAASNGANTGAVNAWTNLTPNLNITRGTYRGELAIAPSNSNRLYLLLEDSATSNVRGIWRSSDGGTVWDSLPAPSALNNGNNSQNWYNLTAAVDPGNPDVLVVGGFHIARSTDAGASFVDINSNIHVDEHTLVYLSSSKLIVGNDGGIYYSPDINTGSFTFNNKNSGYNVTQFYGADFHPTTTNYFLAGAQDNNTLRFTSPGVNAVTAVVGGDGAIPHIDQTEPNIQIGAYVYNNYYRTLDGGATPFAPLSVNNNRGQFINPTDYDDNTNTLYCGDDPGQYFVINSMGGTPTSRINSISQMTTSRQVSAVKVDPFNAATVWIAASWSGNGSSVGPQILKINNANTSSPGVVVNSVISAFPGAYISSIDVDPANANHVLITLSNYGVISVFESTDGGNNWNTIEGNLPDMPVYWGVFAPSNGLLNGASGGTGGILLGTELGVWTTSVINGGGTVWAPETGLPRVRTDMIKWRPSDFTVLVATHGRGLWTSNIPVVTGIPSVNNTKNFIRYATADEQNLFIATGNLNMNKMQVRIFDLNGRLVTSKETAYANQSIAISQLARSSYILKVYGAKGEQYTLQFVKR